MTALFPPPPAFCFAVAIGASLADSSFREVSGLKAEWKSDEVEEGGQNRFVHRLPTRTRYTNVVLKRGIVRMTSPLAYWLSDCFRGDFLGSPVDAQTVNVLLLDPRRRPLVQWSLEGAWPVSWEHSGLDSMQSELAVETIELAYRWFERRTFAYPDEASAA